MTGITLSEAWKRMAPPHPALRPNRGSPRARSPLPVALAVGQISTAWSSAARKNIPLRAYPKSPLQARHPVPMRGAYRDRHGRWVRDAMDAAASGANGIAGRASACERASRRADGPALKRLRRNLGRQHMSRSRGFGGGSRGRQRRVVLAPVAGVKLAEICRAQPGFGESSIRQRRRPKEFGSGKSAL